MMHVMQPVVLDTGWSSSSATTSSTASSCITADRTPASQSSISSSSCLLNGMTTKDMVHDSQPLSISTASFNTLDHVNISNEQSLVEQSANIHTDSRTTSQPGTVESPMKPPKKPLTPYLRFSKAVWPEMKQVNSGRSVCEIGAVIGRMWRELGDADKQPYFESFTVEKAEYDRELKAYLDAHGLKPSDLVKPKASRKKETKKPQQQSQVAGEMTAENQHQQQQQHPWRASAASGRPSADDELLVYHVRPDGTQECYVQRAGDGGGAGLKSAAAAAADAGGGGVGQVTERDVLVSTLAEQTRSVHQLRLQLVNAHARVAELEQQNQVLRQLLRDAQLSLPAR